MNLSALEAMSTEALVAVRDKCSAVLAARSQAQLRRGAVAWFDDASGRRRHIIVERINTKTASGKEVDPTTRAVIGGYWRVGLRLLNVLPSPTAPKVAPVHRPSTAVEALW